MPDDCSIPITVLESPTMPGDYEISADAVKKLGDFLTPAQLRLLHNFDTIDYAHLPPRTYVRWKTLTRKLKSLRESSF